ncbi:MAG: aminoglycoside phosphotransferase family protein [Rickettsiales bacterium]|jgi:aminoglycoside phosphotransferase (APT) family kinase protein|nr:aminoglycoside phosphotransferase family protein [Rickettsiales bacterium]
MYIKIENKPMTEFNPDLQKAKLLLKKLAADKILPFTPSAVAPYAEGGETLSLRVSVKDGSEYAVLFPRSSRSLKSKSDEKNMLDFINSYGVGTTSGVEIPTLIHVNCKEMPFFYMKGFKGEVLYPWNYDNLSDEQKRLLSADLARFLYAMHSIPVAEAAGILPVRGLRAKDDLLKRGRLKDIEYLSEILRANIPDGVLQQLDKSIESFNYSNVVSHGDLHGRNLTVDKSKTKILNGIFDFGMAAVDNRAVDFYKLSVIHRELMRRTVGEYNPLSSEQIEVADVDFIYLALFGSRIKQEPIDGIIKESLRNFSDDWGNN